MSSLTGVQLPVEVSVRVTVPSAMSPMLGTYCAFKVVAFGEKVPLPLDVQMPEVLPPVTDPASWTFWSAQRFWFTPAFTSILPLNSEKNP